MDCINSRVTAHISDETFARLEDDLVEAIGAWKAWLDRDGRLNGQLLSNSFLSIGYAHQPS